MADGDQQYDSLPVTFSPTDPDRDRITPTSKRSTAIKFDDHGGFEHQTQRALLSLLDHPDPYVRCLSAVRALEFDPKAAESVLQALEMLPGLLGHNAEMTLKAWRNRR
jgi:hypothetical protein